MIRFNLPPIRRVMLFFCITFLCLIVCSVINWFIMRGGMTSPRVRISMIVQDMVLFIMPAILTAFIITRQSADFLCVRQRLNWTVLLIVTATVFAAIPAMEYIIEWNKSLTLPESMTSMEQWITESEANATNMVATLIGGHTIGTLIITLLIAAVMAGFSEEIFFRGTIQRLMSTAGVNTHVAVWITAFVFSAVHMQFFGFVPRLLLGAYFGYLLVWTGSLWPAIWAHVLNNALAAGQMWQTGSESAEAGTSAPWLVCLSVLVVIFLLFTTYSSGKRITGNLPQ